MTAAPGEYEIAVPGGSLHVCVEGSGAPVVLIPPFACDTRAVAEQRDALLAAGFQPIAYDPRGYGRSTVPARGVPYSHVDDLVSVLDALGLEKVHLFGVSNGGRIAIDTALLRRTRVHTLSVVGAPLSGYATPHVDALFGALQQVATSEGLVDAKERLKHLAFFTPAYEQPSLARLFDAMLDAYSGYHLAGVDPELLPDPPTSGRLTRIGTPTLIMVGARELPEYRKIAEHLATYIRETAFRVIPAAGHFANLEAPQAVNRALLSFLAGQR